MMGDNNRRYYRINFYDPAEQGVCTLPKSFYGTVSDIAEVVAYMGRNNACCDTVDAFKRFLDGELDVEHYVCHNKERLLYPAQLMEIEYYEIDDAHWEHINAWGTIYQMRASHIYVLQAVFCVADCYYRCVKPRFTGLQYKTSPCGQWLDVGDCFWGNAGMVTASDDSCELALFVEEQIESDIGEIWKNLGDERKLDYSKTCDEILGNT